jgi:hypothetical protein
MGSMGVFAWNDKYTHLALEIKGILERRGRMHEI